MKRVLLLSLLIALPAHTQQPQRGWHPQPLPTYQPQPMAPVIVPMPSYGPSFITTYGGTTTIISPLEPTRFCQTYGGMTTCQ